MKITRYILYISLFIFSPISFTSELVSDINCYQNGNIILSKQQRVREFKTTEHMKLLVDISLGQVNENMIKIYASSIANITCIVKDKD